ncbi:orotidine 5'-phosphate decarboxylase [Candidatus Pacearchaeota archaeon]|nr:orotidine 5'-phosphate decarboxylase [Candidatus Pacearchaeota archaeon]
MQTLKEKWLESVERKNSILCAGLDPAEFGLKRRNKGLPEGVDKVEWSLKYLEAVAPYCAALKPNIKYWGGEKDIIGLKAEIIPKAHELGLIVIDDYKAADLNETNESGIYFNVQMGFDALTIAPYGGNMEGTAKLCKKWDIGAITMCLMSNPENKREKDMLVGLTYDEEKEYDKEDIYKYEVYGGESRFVSRYIQLAHDAAKFGLDGVVVGAPSPDNHITNKELLNISRYVNDKMLVLCPGLGEQGGEAHSILNCFGRDNVIVNVGRGLMFPKGSYSTPEEQAKAARFYKDMLNEKRTI